MIIENFGGKDRGIKFTMLSLEKFEEKIPLTKVPEKTRLIYATVWAGLIGYSSAKDEEQDYTFEDVTDWTDKLFTEGRQDVIKNICDAFAETEIYKNWLKEIDNLTSKIHSIIDEAAEPPKKKAKSNTSGSKSTKSLSVA